MFLVVVVVEREWGDVVTVTVTLTYDVADVAILRRGRKTHTKIHVTWSVCSPGGI